MDHGRIRRVNGNVYVSCELIDVVLDLGIVNGKSVTDVPGIG